MLLLLPCEKDAKGRGCMSLSLHLLLHGCSMQRAFRHGGCVASLAWQEGRAAALGSCSSHLPTGLCRHLA